MKKFKIVFLITFLFTGLQSYSQIAVTGFTNYVVGMNTSKNKTLNFELKVFAYNYVDELPIETNVFYNFKTKEYHRFSIGLGVNLSPFRGFDAINSLVIPASLEIFPIKDFKKIAIVLEVTPELRIDDGAVLRSLIGIRYSFDKK